MNRKDPETTGRRDLQPPAVDAAEFLPEWLEARRSPPSPLPGALLHVLFALAAVAAGWMAFGRLDIVAVAPGKLVPQKLVKVVQPPESGIVREVLVSEGDVVAAGQVLMRMDAALSEADRLILSNELALRSLQLARIDAELEDRALARTRGQSPELFAQVETQYHARRRAYRDALDAEQAVLAKAERDLAAAREIQTKLDRTAPIFREQERAWEQLAREGFAGRLLALDRSRSRIENEQDRQAQAAAVESLEAAIDLARKRIAQVTSGYRRDLSAERVEAQARRQRLEQDLAKQSHRHDLLELRAPVAGTVKDVATHTPGTVVAPGTVLATVVPADEPLEAEVWVSNLDAGQVAAGTPVKVKVAAFPFQRFGMVDGIVRHLSADATERADGASARMAAPAPGAGPSFRALIALEARGLEAGDRRFALTPGMQVTAEMHLGTRTVLDYLLSPIARTVREAGRER